MNRTNQKEINKKLLAWSYHVGCNDNFTCWVCGDDQEATDIHSHHINNAGHFPQQRFLVGNGITLCKECHLLYHQAFMGGNQVTTSASTLLSFKQYLWNLTTSNFVAYSGFFAWA